MSISPLALTAKRVIEAAWLNGPTYDMATQAAEALESAQLLQSPETAADIADGITQLIAPVQALRGERDGTEAYDGELTMFRGLVRVLRIAARNGDLAEVQRLLAEHNRDETAAYAAVREKSSRQADATPQFFQPNRTYRSRNDGYTAAELILTFEVEHVTRHPDRGHLRAIGWARSLVPGDGWHGYFRDEGEFDGWTDITAEGGDQR